MSQVLIYSGTNKGSGDWFEVSDLLATNEFQEFIKEKIKLTTHLAKTRRGRQRTFEADAKLHDVYRFLSECVEIVHKDVEINDPIIGRLDIHPFLKKRYRITIEELK